MRRSTSGVSRVLSCCSLLVRTSLLENLTRRRFARSPRFRIVVQEGCNVEVALADRDKILDALTQSAERALDRALPRSAVAETQRYRTGWRKCANGVLAVPSGSVGGLPPAPTAGRRKRSSITGKPNRYVTTPLPPFGMLRLG